MAQPAFPIEGGLLARPWDERDIPALQRAFTDPEIRYRNMRTLDSHAEGIQLIAARAEGWKSETGASWAVVDENDTLLGYVGLHDISLEFGAAEVGYWVTPEARGHGVATRSLDGLSRWALADLGLHRLNLLHGTTNAASCRVAEKAGFLAEGTVRSYLLHEDGWHDMHLHGRIANDAS